MKFTVRKYCYFIIFTFILGSAFSTTKPNLNRIYSHNEISGNTDSIKLEKRFKSNFFQISSCPIAILIFRLPVIAYYEKVFHAKSFGNSFHPFINIGGGRILYWGGADNLLMARAGFFTGSGKNHFETTFGTVTFFSRDRYPAISIGYRRQKPNKKFTFRTGLGYPEFLYMGLGIGF